MPPLIHIIVPIFNARELVKLCVESVLKHSTGDYRLILIDDASTDRELVAYLDQIDARYPQVQLTHLAVNGGFVKSVNSGLRQSLGRDVLLLNSDAVVTPEYLERIRACAYSDERTGVVTPFSNNATICSMPKFCEDNPLPPLEELDEYARIVTACSLQRRPEIVTGVGFCMYIRAAVIDQVGLLDERYGKGFCEENDLCELAKAAGWKIRLADDVFVAHSGKASFGAAGFEYASQNGKLLLERFPGYLRDVAAFCTADPLREVRENAVYHLERQQYMHHAAVLHLLHANPFRPEAGGTEFHVLDLVESMRAPRALVVYRETDAVVAAEVRDGDIHHPQLHRYVVSRPYEKRLLGDPELERQFEELLDSFRVGVAHIHHLFGWPVKLGQTLRRKRIPYHFTVHDYYCVCPNNNLLDYSTLEPCRCDGDAARTKSCMKAFQRVDGGELVSIGAIGRHRAHFREFLSGAECVIAPSEKARQIVVKALAGTAFTTKVIPHGLRASQDVPVEHRRPESHLRVGMLGCVNYPVKGAEHYLATIRALADEPIDWHFFGDLSAFGFEERLSQIATRGEKKFHGFYSREEIVSKLNTASIDAVLLAAPWHETFSYTLSEALCAGVPVLALRRGAIGERLEALGLATALSDSVPELIESVCSAVKSPERLDAWRALVRRHAHRTLAQSSVETYELYRTALAAAARQLPWPALSPSPAFAAWWRDQQAQRVAANPVVDVEQTYPAFWAAAYCTLKPALPEALRRRVKNRMVRKSSDWSRHFPASALAAQWSISEQTTCRTAGSRVEITAETGDPYIVLPPSLTGESRPDYLRLRLRIDGRPQTNLQLYWSNHAGEGFHEAKSMRIPLAPTEAWQDYVIDLRPAASDGAGIEHLRLDPIDRPGALTIEAISLGRFKR